MTSYYNFIEEYERAQNYIKKETAVPFNKHLINELEREYPYFLETYNKDIENGTKSADRLTPEEEARRTEEEARRTEEEARRAEEEAKAANAAERLKEERKNNPWAGTGAVAPSGFFTKG